VLPSWLCKEDELREKRKQVERKKMQVTVTNATRIT
jgi:hypothetical protein